MSKRQWLKSVLWSKPRASIQRFWLDFFWPGSSPDPSLPSVPLPPGGLGCPWKGSNLRAGTHDFGPGAFYRKQSALAGNPSVFKCYSSSTSDAAATAVLVGSKLSQSVLRHEFDTLQSNTVPSFTAKIVGTHSLRFCQDGTEHAVLRQLVGVGVGRTASALPQLQTAAEQQVQKMLECSTSSTTSSASTAAGIVRMDRICQQFTLSIAQRLILGLDDDDDLRDDTPPPQRFGDAVNDWMKGLYRPEGAEESRAVLVQRIEAKIADLDANGPDGSTISAMLFAEASTDDSESGGDNNGAAPPRRLTHNEVVDNSLLLILAGTETSAGTLTAAMFLLGLHQDSWRRLVAEQEMVRQRFGMGLTQEALQASSFLDAVLKEVMRLAPIASGSARATTSTLSVAGVQIPTGWAVLYDRWLTHRSDPVTALPEDAHMDMKLGFDPDRWLSDSTRPTEYIPFGVGPRYCLGAELAMVEMKVFLASLARTIDFDLVNWTIDTPILFKPNSLTPCPIDGVEIRIRNSTQSADAPY